MVVAGGRSRGGIDWEALVFSVRVLLGSPLVNKIEKMHGRALCRAGFLVRLGKGVSATNFNFSTFFNIGIVPFHGELMNGSGDGAYSPRTGWVLTSKG